MFFCPAFPTPSCQGLQFFLATLKETQGTLSHSYPAVLCSYLDADLPRIRTAILLGSAVPLAMFLSWDALALSLSHSASAFRDPLAVLVASGGPLQATAISAFSLLAIATSFIGTALSMSEFLMEQLGPATQRLFLAQQQGGKERIPVPTSNTTQLSGFLHNVQARVAAGVDSLRSGVLGRPKQHANSVQGIVRAASFLLIVLPPLAVTAAIPDAFMSASEAAVSLVWYSCRCRKIHQS